MQQSVVLRDADNVNGYRFDANLWTRHYGPPRQPGTPAARPASKCIRNRIDDCGLRSFVGETGAAQADIDGFLAERDELRRGTPVGGVGAQLGE